MKSINQMVLLTVVMGLVAVLIHSSISVQPIFAANPHYCFEHDCGGDRLCDNNPKKGTATCCFRDPGTIPQSTTCQTCHVNTSTGEFENCTNASSKGLPDNSIIAPPSSGKAPPSSTEKCPDNTAVGQNGNCTPTTQLPDDTSDNNKPNLRGNILNDMMSTQSQESSDSGEEQGNQNNG